MNNKDIYNYLSDNIKDKKTIAICDTSNQNTDLTEISLAFISYFSKSGKGFWTNKYLSFDNNTKCLINDKENYNEQIQLILQENTAKSFSIEKTSEYLMRMALAHKIPQEDMPDYVVIISDNTINRYFNDEFNWGKMYIYRAIWYNHEYKIPKFILWNFETKENNCYNIDNIFYKITGDADYVLPKIVEIFNKSEDIKMRKKRKITEYYQEVEFCETCNEPMMIDASLCDEQGNPIPVWKCEKCGNTITLTEGNQPREYVNFGEWEDITKE